MYQSSHKLLNLYQKTTLTCMRVRSMTEECYRYEHVVHVVTRETFGLELRLFDYWIVSGSILLEPSLN